MSVNCPNQCLHVIRIKLNSKICEIHNKKLSRVLDNGNKTDLTDEVCAEHDNMKDRAEVEIEKAATETSLHHVVHRAVSHTMNISCGIWCIKI